MMFRVVLVEDEDRDSLRHTISALGGGDIEVVAFPPPSDLDLTQVLRADGDLYMVDYELDTRQPDESIANYRGTTLTARLRELISEYPIVLLTRSDLPSWTSARRAVTVGATFDSVLFKDTDLRSSPEATYATLLSLADGYRELRERKERTVFDLLDLLKTDAVGQEQAIESIPLDDGWTAFEAAKWIRSVLLHYPGVLYPQTHAAIAMGLSLDSFDKQEVMELLESAEYRGPFSQERRHWWRHKLFDIAHQYSQVPLDAFALRRDFPSAAGDALGLKLESSEDPQTGIGPADTVCYLLDFPVRVETSLPYRPDTRPPIMDEARISFKAIRETNKVDSLAKTRFEEVPAL